MSTTADEIYAWVVGEIDSGRLKPGHTIPGEHQLKDRFQAARGTVRAALRRLTQDGRLDPPKQGRPRTVREKGIWIPKLGFERSLSFGDHLRELGHGQPHDRTTAAPECVAISRLEKELRLTAARVSSALQLPRNRRVFWARRIRCLGDLEVALQWVVVPASLVEVAAADMVPGGLTRRYELVGVRRHSADATYRATVATRDEARQLNVETGSPLIREERVSYSRIDGTSDPTPYEFLVSLYGDRVSLGFHWTDPAETGPQDL